MKRSTDTSFFGVFLHPLRMLLLLALFCFGCFSGYPAYYRMERIDSRDGLSNSAVLTMFQDQKGYIWAGTYNGLNRYDGKFIESYFLGKNSDGAQSSNIIQNIQAADSNHLWISAYMGLSKFSTSQNKVVENYADYRAPYNLVSNGRNLTYLLAKKNRLSIYDRSKKTFVDLTLSGLDPTTVIRAFIDPKDVLWVFSSDRKVWNIRVYPNKANTHLNLNVKRLHFHTTPIVYAFEENGLIFFVDKLGDLYSYDIDRKRSTYIRNVAGLISSNGELTSIASYHDDLLVSFKGTGILRLVTARKYQEEWLFVKTGVFCLHKDKHQDVLWIGSDCQGIVMYSKKSSIFNTLKSESLPISKPIRSISTDKDNTLWIGTKGDGLLRIRDYDKFEGLSIPKTNVTNYTSREGLTNNQVFAIVKSKYHNLNWLATEGPELSYYAYWDEKIHPLVNETGKPILSVHSVLEENDSTLWLTTSDHGFKKVNFRKTGRGLVLTQCKTYMFLRGKKSVTDFFSMSKDKNGILWIGSRGDGVVRFNPKDGRYRFVTSGKGLNSTTDDVLSCCNSKKSFFYFGTSTGLYKMSRENQKLKLIPISQQNENSMGEMIHGMQEDKSGSLWMSTNRGLLKYNPKNNDFRICLKHTGLDVIEFSDNADYTCPYSHRIFFGGIDGVVWVEQNVSDDEDFTPPIQFNGLKLNGLKVNMSDYLKRDSNGEYLELSNRQNTFSVSFVAIDYLHSNNMEYFYSLENYNNEWVNASDLNEASFNELHPGHYTLKVKYKDDVFDTESNYFTLPIVVLPPWYLSTVAWMIYFFLFFLSLLLGIRIVRNNILKKQQDFNRAVIEKNKEELYEAKMKFFTNITHEVLTPLTLIQGPCDRIRSYRHSDEYVKKYANLLHVNVSRLQLLIHEIINFSKREEFGMDSCVIESVQLNEVVEPICMAFSEIVETNRIDFKMDLEQDLYWNTDPSCLNKILTNLISNAFKYTPKGGKIRISIQKDLEELTIKVYNTGKGIPREELHTVFDRFRILDKMDKNVYLDFSSRNGLGLAICYSMIQLLKGRVEVTSKENKYAEFTVNLPYLPLSEAVEVPEHVQVEQMNLEKSFEAEAVYSLLGSGMKKILIVDDNKEIVWMISDLMSDKYELIKAYNAQDALKLMDNDLPELIVVDLMMPGELDGADLVRQVKSNRFTNHIPIIIISAKISIEEQMEGMGYGADLYVTKPFDLSYLRAMIEQLIEKRTVLRDYYNSPLSAVELKGGQLIHHEEQDLLMQVSGIVDKNLSKGELRPEFIAEKLKLSPQVFYRRFKAISSLSPSEFVKQYRFAVAAKLLLSTNLSVQEVIYKVGINNRSYFYREFSKLYNKTPKEYRLLNEKSKK